MAYTGNIPSITQFPTQNLVGDGTTRNFTLNYPVANDSSILVSNNGAHVSINDYNAGGTAIEFTTAPLAGAQIEILWLGVPTITQGTPFYTNVSLTSTLVGISITASTVPPTASFQIGGVLGVASGGTGITTPGQNLLLTSPQSAGSGFGTLPYGSANQVLTSGGTNALPTWGNVVNSLTIPSNVGLTLNSTTGSVSINGGVLSVGFGGTGAAGLPNAGVVLGGGNAQLRVVAGPGAAGQVLTANGTNNDPSWQNPTVTNWSDPTAVPIGTLVFGRIIQNEAFDYSLPVPGGTQVMSVPIPGIDSVLLRVGNIIGTGASQVDFTYGTWRFLGSTFDSSLPIGLWVRVS